MAVPLVLKDISAPQDRLGRIINTKAVAVVEQAMTEFAEELKTAMQVYPPPAPRQRYRRTYRLRRSWYKAGPVRVSGHIRVVVSSDPAIARDPRTGFQYAAVVQGGRRYQWPFFAARGWQRITDTQRRLWDKYRKRIQRAFARR